MLSNVAIGVLAVVSAVSAVPTMHTSSGDALVKFLETRATTWNLTLSSEAEVVYPNDASWENDTSRWSLWSAPTYSVAFLPATEQDITIGLQYLTQHNISFLAQCGGHGNTLTFETVRDAVVINMEKFNHIMLNDDNTITAGGGAIFGDVYPVAYNAQRELPLGSCPCVGVGGASIGGGHSRLQGEYGLIIDVISKLRVALWNGTIVDVTADENEDLFWAMRGAGHNFGIVLEYTFDTFPQQNDGMNYNGDMTFTIDSLEGVLCGINELIPDQNPGLSMDFFVIYNQTTGIPGIMLNIVHHGSLEEGQAFADRFSSNNETGIQQLTKNETMVPWPQVPTAAGHGAIVHACTEGLNYDVYTVNTKLFDIAQQRALIDSYVAFVQANPLAAASILLYEVFAQQAVLAADADAAAFGNREYGNIMMLLQGTYRDAAAAPAWQDWAAGWREQLWDPEHSGYPVESVYMNYARGDEPLRAQYGYEPWRQERLAGLKAKYDPRGFFNHYNSVLGNWDSPN